MFFYNWREMAAWVAIFVVAATIVIVGVQSGGDAGILRLAVGPKDSYQHQAGEALKRLIERRTAYQVALVHSEDSQAAQHLLLDRKADVALLAPVALSIGQQWVAVAPVASLFAHVLVDTKVTNKASLYDFKPGEISMGEVGSDSYALGHSILQALELAPRQDMSLDEGLAPADSPATLITDHFSGPEWQTLLSDGRYRMLPLREAAALNVKEPLWVSAVIPAYVYSFAAKQLPSEAIDTVATPLVLGALADAAPTLIAELGTLMQSAEGLALAARFHQAATANAWQLLPKHAAVGGDALPVRELLREELAWWIQHKTLVLLIIAAALLVILQTRNLRHSRAAARTHIITHEMENMLGQLLTIEQRARTDHDLRTLYQLLDEANHLKVRGSKLILGSSLVHDPLLTTFHQQCNHVSALLEKRLQGKPAMAAVA